MDTLLDFIINAGSQHSRDDLASLLGGIASAPRPRRHPHQWQTVLDIQLSPSDAEHATALLDKIRHSRDTGLREGPVPSTRLATTQDMVKSLGLDGAIITRTDEFQGEYVSENASRLLWLTGFSGSAGIAVVGLEKSAIFVDGRYTIQVTEQVNNADFDYAHLIKQPPYDWIGQHFKGGARIGFNPTTLSDKTIATYQQALRKSGVELVPLDTDVVDMTWGNQPPKPISPMREHPLHLAGKSTTDKHEHIKSILMKNGADAGIVCLPDSFCWLLNVRGGDVPATPFVHGYMVVTQDDIHAFVDKRKIPAQNPNILQLPVTFHEFDTFDDFLGQNLAGKTVMINDATTPYKSAQTLRDRDAHIINAPEICELPRACKNQTEINGAKDAHVKDGIAVVKFLHWLDDNVASGALTELSCSQKLTDFRFEDPDMLDISFTPISGVAGNGALCHYDVTEKTDTALTMNELYLIDSGGQYGNCTTDITRTVVLGTATSEQKDRATRVLKGLIALQSIQFPHGVSGMNLDVLARQFLYAGGYDYDHGTGHGVGSYLSVHEGPVRFGIKGGPDLIEPGMLLTIEPGYYKTDEYGIRLENLVVVREPNTNLETPMLSFENITWCPLDTRLFDKKLLTTEEVNWLNTYHAEVYKTLSPHLEKATKDWLKNATKAI